MEEMKKVKTAIVGCGMISSIYFVNLRDMFSIIDLVACADIDQERARQTSEKFGIAKAMTVEDVMKDEEIELILNLTAPGAHYSVVKQALLAGKHVFTEKMLCTDIEEGRELLKIADEKKLYLGVAPDTFLGAGLQSARYYIEAGMIGKPTTCLAAINRNHALNSEFYGYIKYKGGGFAYDVGVYYLTALLSLMGPVKKIAGFTGLNEKIRMGTQLNTGTYGKVWPIESNNLMAASLLFENGVLGTLHFNGECINDQQPNLVIYGTEGILYLGDPNNFGPSIRLLRRGATMVELPFTHGYDNTPCGRAPSEWDHFQQRGLGLSEMAWAIRKNRKHRASKEMGFHTLEVLCGMDIASETGKAYEMTSTFEIPKALPKGYTAHDGWLNLDQEIAIID